MNRRSVIFVVLLLFTLRLSAQSAGAPPVVNTALGSISGRIAARSLVVSFKGIPFAAAPVGDLRWRPPIPAPHWEGTRDGSHFGASCMQSTRKEFLPWTEEFLTHNQVSEDCLFLNIWTPQPVPNATLPVIVYIHGGAFTEGAGDVAVYDGEGLAATGLVVVTINYRLGVLGFLAHPELTAESPHHSSGDYGLLDQIAALKWVRTNIQAFGGDPNRVTIWGQSAGAFSVGALIASPEAKGLFQRAMADSGLGIRGIPTPTLEAEQNAGIQFAASRHAQNLKELRALPADALILGPQERSLPFGPIVDGWVLPDTPAALSKRGADSDVPILTGYQANDWMLGTPPVHSTDDFGKLAEHLYGPVAPDFERLYPGSTVEQAQSSIVDSSRDRARVSMFLWAQERMKTHGSPIFTYFFDHPIPWPQHPEFGAFHTGEIPYFFRNLWVLDRPWTTADFNLARLSSSYLKSFATTGDPNMANLPQWPAVSPSSPSTMEIGSATSPMSPAGPTKFNFWVRYFNSPESAQAPLF